MSLPITTLDLFDGRIKGPTTFGNFQVIPGEDIMGEAPGAAGLIKERWNARPRLGLILGTGAGRVAKLVATDAEFAFADLPGLAAATAPDHMGKLVCGSIAATPTVAACGRLHLYEGRSRRQTAALAELIAALGAEVLVLVNAAGGLAPRQRVGDVVVLADHLDLMGKPQRSPIACRRGCRTIYDPGLREMALGVARWMGFHAEPGVYAAVAGPNYETRAEYRMLRRLGADCVGMSTAPEAAAAASRGLRVLGLSVITNVAHCGAPHTVSSHQVVDAARAAEPKIEAIIRRVAECCESG